MNKEQVRLFISNGLNVASKLPFNEGYTTPIPELTGIDPKHKESVSKAYDNDSFMIVRNTQANRSLFRGETHTYSTPYMEKLLQPLEGLELICYSRNNKIINPWIDNLTLNEIKDVGKVLNVDDKIAYALFVTYLDHTETKQFNFLANQ